MGFDNQEGVDFNVSLPVGSLTPLELDLLIANNIEICAHNGVYQMAAGENGVYAGSFTYDPDIHRDDPSPLWDVVENVLEGDSSKTEELDEVPVEWEEILQMVLRRATNPGHLSVAAESGWSGESHGGSLTTVRADRSFWTSTNYLVRLHSMNLNSMDAEDLVRAYRSLVLLAKRHLSSQLIGKHQARFENVTALLGRSAPYKRSPSRTLVSITEVNTWKARQKIDQGFRAVEREIRAQMARHGLTGITIEFRKGSDALAWVGHYAFLREGALNGYNLSADYDYLVTQLLPAMGPAAAELIHTLPVTEDADVPLPDSIVRRVIQCDMTEKERQRLRGALDTHAPGWRESLGRTWQHPAAAIATPSFSSAERETRELGSLSPAVAANLVYRYLESAKLNDPSECNEHLRTLLERAGLRADTRVPITGESFAELLDRHNASELSVVFRRMLFKPRPATTVAKRTGMPVP